MATDRAEYEIFTQSNNCEQILNRMVNKEWYNLSKIFIYPLIIFALQKNTLGTIERELITFKSCTERDFLINEAVNKSVNGILANCKMHVKSCREAFKSISEDPLLSETTAKSLLSLVIHRPLLFSNHKSLFPDVESLLLIK